MIQTVPRLQQSCNSRPTGTTFVNEHGALPAVTHTVAVVVPADADIEDAGTTVELDVEDESTLTASRAGDLWLSADR